jgi:hypothetical protein
MPERKLRAIILGVIMWAFLFGIGTAVMYKLGEEKIGVILFFMSPMVSIPLAYWYMRAPKEKSAVEGFKLGLTWVVLSMIMDVIFLVYVFNQGWEYFHIWTVWIGYSEVMILATIVGALMKPELGMSEAEGKLKEEKKVEEKVKGKEGETIFFEKRK